MVAQRGTFNGETRRKQGVEINGEWQATDNLSFQGSAYFARCRVHGCNLDPAVTSGSRPARKCQIRRREKYWLAAEYTIPDIGGFGDLWFRYDTSYQAETWDNVDAAIDEDPTGRRTLSRHGSPAICRSAWTWRALGLFR